MNTRKTIWLLLILALVVGAGYWHFHKNSHSAATALGSPNGNVDLSKYGLIEGDSGFPEAVPSDLKVCGQNTGTKVVTCTNAYSDDTSSHGLSYKLAVLPGTYQVYSSSQSHPDVGKGYYNTITKCTPTVDEDDSETVCKKTEVILPVTIAAGQTVQHIDAWWYANVYDSK